MPDCWWMGNLNEFFSAGKFSDVSIHVQDRTFKCHRIVLASASEYFSTMFGGNFSESSAESVTLFDIDAISFESILKCMYTSTMPTVETSNALDLLRTSEFLGVKPVAEHCAEFVLRHISSLNCLEVFSVARGVNHKILIDCAIGQIVKYFAILTQNSAFMDMLYEDLEFLIKRYRSTYFQYTYENFLLNGLIRWLHSGEGREKSFEKLIELVDFKRISRNYLKFLWKECNIECRISEERGANQRSTNESTLQKGLIDDCQPMNCSDALPLPHQEAGLFSEKRDANQVFTSESTLKKALIDGLILRNESVNCSDALPLPHQESRLSDIMSTLHVYLILPYERRESEYSVFSFHKFESDEEWYHSCSFKKSCLSSCIDPVCCFIAVNKLNYLYCLEYPEEWLEFRAYSSIDLSSSPRVLASLPFHSSGKHQPVLCEAGNNSIYLYESNIHDAQFKCKTKVFDEEELRRGIFSYNCEINKWFPVPGMKKKLSDSFIMADDKLVYLIGGVDSKNIGHERYVQAYDNRMSQWLELPNTINPYSLRRTSFQTEGCLGGCAARGKLYICSGSQMEVFEPTASKWETISWAGEAERKKRRPVVMYFYDNTLWVFDECYCIWKAYDFVTQEWRDVTPEFFFGYSNIPIFNVVAFKSLELSMNEILIN